MDIIIVDPEEPNENLSSHIDSDKRPLGVLGQESLNYPRYLRLDHYEPE